MPIGLSNNASLWSSDNGSPNVGWCQWQDGSPYDFLNWAADEPKYGQHYATLYTGAAADGVFGQWYGG